MDDRAITALLARLEEAREAARVTDSRAARAREAMRDVRLGYGALLAHLTEPNAQDMLNHLIGEPVRRACEVLGIEDA